MAVCTFTGKRGCRGTGCPREQQDKRRYSSNIQSKQFFIPEQNRWVRLSVSTRAIRTIDKIGCSLTPRAGIKI